MSQTTNRVRAKRTRRRTPRPSQRVMKTRTGVRGLDEVLEGGVPRGRVLLVMGGTGSGKTVLMNEFLYRGIERYGERGVFVTCEERVEDITRNVAGFGWDYAALVASGRLAFVDAGPRPGELRELGADYDLSPLLARVRAAIRRMRAKRLVIDGLDGLFARLSNRDAVRELVLHLSDEAKALGITTLISAESLEGGATRHGVEEFVVDGALRLAVERGQQQMLRRLEVLKLRGTGFRSGAVEYAISGDGLEVFAKIPVNRRLAATRLDVRKRLGIPGFDDEIAGGGIPEGFLVLVTGNTGTGKSTFLQHFIAEGVRRGEAGVYFALEEPSGQVRKLAAAHGWNFAAWEKAGRLALLDVSLIDVRPDEVLHRLVRAVDALGAKRVVIDSISSLHSATMDSEQVRQFMLQLGEQAKARGATCLMSSLVGGAFGAEKGQLLSALEASDVRLSSAADGLILQRYVERGQRVKKLLTVIKLRGTDHDRGIHRYEVTPAGIVMRGKYEE